MGVRAGLRSMLKRMEAVVGGGELSWWWKEVETHGEGGVVMLRQIWGSCEWTIFVEVMKVVILVVEGMFIKT